ncbi:MAG: hypothetical protein FWE31_05115 [Firmicutes bacterium]|nr:hypothetical protein [Bacillota bacterium]
MKKLSIKIVAFVVGLAFLVAAPLAIVSAVGTSANILDFNHVAPTQAQHAFASAVVPVMNPSFGEPSVARFSENVSGWTQTRTERNAVTGVVNVRDFQSWRSDRALFPNDFPPFLASNPLAFGEDDNILVLSNTTSVGRARTGFTSTPVELHQDGYFLISFDFFALGSRNNAYLMDEEGEIIATMPVNPVDQNGMWRTASFFLRTDTRQSLSMTLNLHLGTQGVASAGVVYYDNVQIMALNPVLFETQYTQRNNSSLFRNNLVRVDLRDHEEFGQEYPIELDDFVRNPLTPNLSGTQMRTIRSSQAWQRGILNFENRNFIHTFDSRTTDNEVLLISAINGNASMRWNETLRVERHLTYMLSFYALTQGATNIRLHDPRTLEDNLPEHIEPFDSGFLPIGTAIHGGSNAQNNWILNTIFISGAALEDNDIYLEFWIGEEDSPATGWLMIDSISLVRVSNEYLEQSAEALNVHNLTLRTAIGEGVIENAQFNIGTIASAVAPFPLVAESWTIDALNEDDTINGIINTAPAHWNRFASGNFGNAQRNPGQIPGNPVNNNVFMLQNTRATRQTLTSSTFVLNPGVWNVVSFDLAHHIQHSNLTTVTASIVINGDSIVTLDLSNVNQNWRTHRLAVNLSEFSSTDATLVFALETTQGFATIFIDNVDVEQEFILPSGITAATDLSDPIMIADEFGNSRFFQETDGIGNGRVNAWADRQSNWLRLSTAGFQNASIENTFTKTLDGPAFFRYTVTAHLTIHGYQMTPPRFDDQGELIEEPDDIEHGISLSLRNFDGGFNDIKSQDMHRMPQLGNGWVEFAFYVRTTAEQNLNLVIQFGNEWRLVDAVLLIRETTLTRIDETDWNTARDIITQRDRDELPNNRALATESTWSGDDDGDDGVTGTPPGDGNNQAPGGGAEPLDWLLIPSLILAAALIFALAAWLTRRLRFNRHMSKRYTTYAKDDAGIKGAPSLEDLIATDPNRVAEEDDL